MSEAKPAPSSSEIFDKAMKRALGGGLAGGAAMGFNIATLMWMRTTINYQYRYGMGTMEALRTLYKEGGIPRFYRGVVPALFQGPLSRFGDTAANTGVLVLLDAYDMTKDIPVAAKTVLASVAAATWRIFLMPIDTMKTTLQVEGPNALKGLFAKVGKSGPTVLYHGALAASSATFVGHYPWFFTFNYLQATIPEMDTPVKKFLRNGLIGFCASAVSDTCSNSIRVIKVYKQANLESVSYVQAAKEVIAKDGLIGLFGRGLKTKIIANGMQGLMFSALWKEIDNRFFKNKN